MGQDTQAKTGKFKAHHTPNGFRNPFNTFEDRGFKDFMRWVVWDRFIKSENKADADSLEYSLLPNDGSALRDNDENMSVTWIGHSTLLLQIDGLNILTDPVWSERASPVSWAGPRRMVEPGLKWENLPDIDVVIISHDHYDHLDEETIKKIGDDAFFLVPLGVGKFFEKLGITNMQEFDWWNSITFNGVEFVCTPTQHFSGRTLFDRNSTLWCSWVIVGEQERIYFAGDSGYFPGFKEIGERYGPFDLAAIPIGAYKPRWFMEPMHVDPRQAVDIYTDVKARYFVPIHWGTFILSDEGVNDPPRELLHEVEIRKLDADLFKILRHGESFFLPQQEKMKNITF